MYYRDRLYLQVIATIFESSLTVAVKSDLTATTSKEKKEKIASVLADNTHFATVSTEVMAVFYCN